MTEYQIRVTGEIRKEAKAKGFGKLKEHAYGDTLRGKTTITLTRSEYGYSVTTSFRAAGAFKTTDLDKATVEFERRCAIQEANDRNI